MRKIDVTVSAAAAALAFVVTTPAFAVQSDAFVDQIAGRTGSASVDQVSARTVATPFIAQVEAADTGRAYSFQATTEVLRFADATAFPQISPTLAAQGGPAAEMAFLGLALDLGKFNRVSGSGKSEFEDKDGNRQLYAWNGENNLQVALQTGTNNFASLETVGSNNVAFVLQDGANNSATTQQFASNAFAAILQYGQGNQASIYQGSNSSFAFVSQNGVGNVVSIRQ